MTEHIKKTWAKMALGERFLALAAVVLAVSAGFIFTIAAAPGSDSSEDTPDYYKGFAQYLEESVYAARALEIEDALYFSATIAGGDSHSLYARYDGTAWGWGKNSDGQIGIGAVTEMEMTAVQVHGPDDVGFLSDVIAVGAGQSHSVALKGDGTVWCFGNGGAGRLGHGTTESSATPVQVEGLSNIVAISVGHYHSLALAADAVWSWGKDGTGKPNLRPVKVEGLEDVTALAAGDQFSVAVSGGEVWMWGRDICGGQGGGKGPQDRGLRQVEGLTNIVAVAAGHSHVLALGADQKVYAFGSNSSGQLGDGTRKARSTPVQVLGPALSGVEGLEDIVSIAAGHKHSVALTRSGEVLCWGCNDDGQLGDGTTETRTSPVEMLGITSAIGIAAGHEHTIVLLDNRTVWTCGANESGQLGNGTTDPSSSPSVIDSDADGLPDEWEYEHFGDLSQGPEGDYDADGVNNLMEYQRETDPTDPLSVNVTIYVNNQTGNDSYDGISPVWDGRHGPKKRIVAAIDVAISGDTVEIGAGTYRGEPAVYSPGARSITLKPVGKVTIVK